MSAPEIADLFRELVAAGELNASKAQWKVINAIMNCRTAALGGQLYRCTSCGKEEPRYHSCRNRHCPKCQGEASAKWLDDRMEELLPVPYFHAVFTIPHELNGIVLQNKVELLNILFRSVTKTLTDVAKTRLGGEIGFISVLHTWGQKLEAHPHIHCVVPGAIKGNDGTIKRADENYLLPKQVLSIVFRAVFIKALVQAFKKGKLEFHGNQTASTFFALVQTIKAKHWLVYLKKPFSGPGTVLKYLARYTHRVGISNSRILKAQSGSVTFAYKDYADNCQKKHCTLTTSEFTRRFLLHVLPHQFVRIRHCGFLAPGKRTNAIAQIKERLGSGQPPVLTPGQALVCTHCGASTITRISEISPLLGSLAHRTKILPLVA